MQVTMCAMLLAGLAMDARPISLEEAIQMGLERSPALAMARAGLDSADAGETEARAARWPRVTTEAGWHSTDQQVMVFSDKLTSGTFTADDFALDQLNDPDPQSHAMAAITLEMPLYTFGRLDSGIQAAASLKLAARAALAAAESSLIERITAAYFAIPRARTAVAVAEAALAGARAQESAASARFDSGAALRSDLLRAQVRRLSRESEQQRRLAELEVARARLRDVMGLDPGENVEPITDLIRPSEEPGDLETWLERAQSGRPEVQAARARLDAAGADAAAARAARRPELGGLARYEVNADGLDAGTGAYLLGLRLRWDAYDRALAPAVARADASLRAAEAALRAVSSGVQLDVETAWREVHVADHALGAAREAVTAAESAHRIASERYAGGLMPITDLLETETALVGARMDETAALYEAVVSRARLARASGTKELP